MTVRDFALPDLGEGLTESELVSWRVAVGDVVELNQIIAEVETAKALVELPSPFAGVVSRLYAEPGETVKVGAPIVAFDVSDGAEASGGAGISDGAEASGGAGISDGAGISEGAAPVVEDDAVAQAAAPAAIAREPVLVGYGAPVDQGTRPRRRPRRGLSVVESVGPSPAKPQRATRSTARSTTRDVRSTPPVRTLARELGVDLADVTGTGDHGLITREDVQASASSSAPTTGRETRTPIQGVRRLTAQAMVESAFTAPHVTEFLTVDVTPTMDLLAELRERRAFAGQHLTILTIVAKALCIAVARTPSVNSHWDDEREEIVQFGYVNLGIAAATPRGLMVPNIKDAERLDLAELASRLQELVETAKAGKSGQAELRGGTISITNVGVFGVDAGTPILNPGEAVILAMGAVRRMPWEFRDDIALRQVMTLSLSFDHRLVDGEQASRFLTDIGAILSNPGLALTMV